MASTLGELPSLTILAALLCIPPALFLMVSLRRRARILQRRDSATGTTFLSLVALVMLAFNGWIVWTAGPGPISGEPMAWRHWTGLALSWISLWGWLIVGMRRLFRRRYVL